MGAFLLLDSSAFSSRNIHETKQNHPDHKLRSYTGAKRQPKEKSFRAGDPADVPGSFVRTSRVKTLGRPSKLWKNKHLGADVHENARTSIIPGG